MLFNRLRSKYSGPVNKAAYLGMMGDIAVVSTLYVLYKIRKDQKASVAEAKAEAQKIQNLTLYPPKTESIDYNKFSPYTPIQYYVDEYTKYQNYHLDLVGYLNENQINTSNYYYRDYHDSYDTKNSNHRNNNWHYPDFSRFEPKDAHGAHSEHH